MSTFRPTAKAFLQMLWNGEETSIPCLFLFTDTKRYVFNCSEGVQRLFTQRKIKLGKLDTFFLTRYQWSHMGGLPGFGLTLRDMKNDGQNKVKFNQTIKDGAAALKANSIQSCEKSAEICGDINPEMEQKKKNAKTSGDIIPEVSQKTEKLHKVTIYAPPGMKNIMKATKHFLRFDEHDLNFEVTEQQEYEDEEITVHSIPIYSKSAKTEAENKCLEDDYTKTVEFSHPHPPSLSYICHLRPLPGKFNVKTAKKLGVPLGPLFGMLQKGNPIELDNGKKVTPEEVLGPEIPGPKFLIMDCPAVSYVENMTQNTNIGKYLLEEEGVHLVVHLSPEEVCEDAVYSEWTRKFPSFTKHIYLNRLIQDSIAYDSQHCLQIMLNHIDSKIFPLITQPTLKTPCNALKNFIKINLRELMNNSSKVFDDSDVKSKINHSVLMERVNKVLNGDGEDGESGCERTVVENMNGKRLCSGEQAPIPHKKGNFDVDSSLMNTCIYPKVICLGTGASLPSKYRNVSATLIFLSEENAVLLDCGEGTYGQLLRHYGDKVNNILLKIKFIFVSHMHADHHLGLIALITKINKLKKQIESSFIIMAPNLLLEWLTAYALISESLNFKFINCEDACHGISVGENLDVQAVKVDHPGHAYGLVLKYNEIKITYSGDTMPCQSLIDAGSNSKLLIHEATLEDEMIEDAKDRKHSTTTQALQVAQKMNAEFVLLTHFSQRYPKLPIVKDDLLSSKIAYAFDHMEVSLNDIQKFCGLVPILNALLAEEDGEV